MGIFRTFEYNGRVLQLATYEPEPPDRPPLVASASAPGAGKFEIGPVSLSAAKIAPGESLTLTARIRGKNIAFIYTDVLLHDKDLNQLYGPVAREYVQADRNKEIGGVCRPDWENEINLAIRLELNLRLVTDGTDFALGFLLPEGYSGSDYRLDGLYATADGATRRRARISFDSAGETKNLVAFQEQGGSAAPHALTLNPNDQFTPFVQILTQPTDESPAWGIATGLGTLLTFRGEPLRWMAKPLMPGEYWVGLLVQDLDGGFTRQYAPLTVGEF